MNFFPFFRPRTPEPLPHVVVRYHAATKAENKQAQQRRADVRLELAVYAATTTPEQRRAEADRFFAAAAAKAKRRRRTPQQKAEAIERAKGRG